MTTPLDNQLKPSSAEGRESLTTEIPGNPPQGECAAPEEARLPSGPKIPLPLDSEGNPIPLDESSRAVHAGVEVFRQRLVDLGLRNNPLLNFQASRGKRGLFISDESAQEVFRILVEEGKRMSFEEAPVTAHEDSAGNEEPVSGVIETPMCEGQPRGEAEISVEFPLPASRPLLPSPRPLPLLPGPVAETGEAAPPSAPSPQALPVVTGESEAASDETSEEPLEFAQPDEAQLDPDSPHRFDLKLRTLYSATEVQTRLLKTYQDAKVALDEQGANCLFLALGFVSWEDRENGTLRRAPLVRIPVKLERSSVMEKFRVSWTGAEIEPNLALSMRLGRDFGIELPTFSFDEDFDLEAFYASVEAALSGRSEAKLDRDSMAIGLFSSGRLMNYRDLDSRSRGEGERLWEQPCLRALLAGDYERTPVSREALSRLDEAQDRMREYQVVDCDSSQTRAIMTAESSTLSTIFGPPGTGKTQTITNLIAQAIAAGKSVLMVARKSAALEVEEARLNAAGLGHVYLHLYGTSISKKDVIESIRESLTAGKPKMNGDGSLLKHTRDLMRRLSAYREELIAPVEPAGVNPYSALERLVELSEMRESAKALGAGCLKNWSKEALERNKEQARALSKALEEDGVPGLNPFYGAEITGLSPEQKQALTRQISAARQKGRALSDVSSAVLSQLGRPSERIEPELKELLAAMDELAAAPSYVGSSIGKLQWETSKDMLRKLAQAAQGAKDSVEKVGPGLKPEAWGYDVAALKNDLASSPSGLPRFKTWGSYRATFRLWRLSNRWLPPLSKKKQQSLIEAIEAWQSAKKSFEEAAPILSPLKLGSIPASAGEGAAPWSQLGGQLEWVNKFCSRFEKTDFLIPVLSALSVDEDRVRLQDRATELKAAYAGYCSDRAALFLALEFNESAAQERFERAPLKRQQAILSSWESDSTVLAGLTRFNLIAADCRKHELGFLVSAASTWADKPENIPAALEYAWCEAVFQQAVTDRPALGTFDREKQSSVIEQFAKSERQAFAEASARVNHRLWERLPRLDTGGRVGILGRELKRERGHMPIRKLFEQAGPAVQEIKPVFMMSPEAVSRYLPPGMKFDLLIIDEGSQLTVEEALGAAARCRSIAVAGDQKQLQPTDFFMVRHQAETPEEVDEDVAAARSILDAVIEKNAPSEMLRYAYRFRHESLIAPSNHLYYDARLVVIPSPDLGKVESGLRYHYIPNSVYDRGGNASNVLEAREVVKAIMEHAKNSPALSLGSVAMSEAQSDTMAAELERARRHNPSLEAFFENHKLNPFFTKPLVRRARPRPENYRCSCGRLP